LLLVTNAPSLLQEKVVTGPPVEIQVRVNVGIVSFMSVVSWI